MVRLRYLFTSFLAFMALIILGVMNLAASPPGADLPYVTGEISTPLVADTLTVPTMDVAGYGVQVETVFIETDNINLTHTETAARAQDVDTTFLSDIGIVANLLNMQGAATSGGLPL